MLSEDVMSRASLVSSIAEDLRTEMLRLPGEFAFWAAQYAAVKRDHARLRLAAKETRGATYTAVRFSSTTVKITEAALEAALDCDKACMSAKAAECDAEADVAYLYNLLEALRIKRDALVQLASTERQEMRASIEQ